MVTEFNQKQALTFKDDDFTVDTKRGSGNGGQHRNKTDSMVVMTHKATGIKASIDGRNQHQNKKQARKIVEQRVQSMVDSNTSRDADNLKKELAGSGERGDKIRTYRFQDGIVTDHRNGRKCQLKDLINGKFEKII